VRFEARLGVVELVYPSLVVLSHSRCVESVGGVKRRAGYEGVSVEFRDLP
jgi:hypothetical protein